MNWERRLYLTAYPLAYPLMRALARLGDAVRVPGVGIVVNSAPLGRQILLDGETFRKDGPGSPSDLWTPILGPSVLLNMEGEAHRTLRAKLAELFTASYSEGLCARVLATPLAGLAADLGRGVVVDLADRMRLIASALISEVIGLEQRTEAGYRRLFAQGEQVVSMVSLRNRRLTQAQIDQARRVLEPIGESAAHAYQAGGQDSVMGRMRDFGLSEVEARGAACAFFLTGTETVATLVPRLIALLHDTGQLGRVAGDLSLLDTAIEEAMRVTTPTPVMLRSVHRSTRVGGVAIRPGDRVVLATHNCCRALGPFNLDQPPSDSLRRLWFGAGPHFCIGYPLAMAQIRAVARSVLAAGPVRVVSRRAARRVLIPAYQRLEIAA
jgi:cytochrome P450